jgi:hypothetical protein
VRRFTLVTIIVLLIALAGLAVYHLFRAPGEPVPGVTPTASP